MFALNNVDVTYGGYRALRDISLRFDEGTVTTLVGPSGCGKTTLLNTLNGLVVPDRGAVRVDGESISDPLSIRRRIGYVLQNGGLFPHMTAYDNAALPMRLQNWEADKVDTRIRELQQLVRLDGGDLLQRFPNQLSGGQKQRIGIMRALALDPDSMLLDEPFGALDPMVRRELQDDLKHVFTQLKKTVVFVTHDMAEAAFMGEQIVLMNEGRVVQIGTYESLLEHPTSEFVTQFLNAHDRRASK